MPDDTPPETPLVYVFQCKQCKTIIGDSLAWVCSNEELASITLNAVPADVVQQSTEMDTSREGITFGSTYSILSCVECGTILGKMYHTTTRPLDHIRDHYTLLLSALTTYQLGNSPSANSPPTSSQTLLSIPTASTLKASLFKTQNLLRLLHDAFQERMTAAETEVTTIRSHLGMGGTANNRISGVNGALTSAMTEVQNAQSQEPKQEEASQKKKRDSLPAIKDTPRTIPASSSGAGRSGTVTGQFSSLSSMGNFGNMDTDMIDMPGRSSTPSGLPKRRGRPPGRGRGLGRSDSGSAHPTPTRGTGRPRGRPRLHPYPS